MTGAGEGRRLASPSVALVGAGLLAGLSLRLWLAWGPYGNYDQTSWAIVSEIAPSVEQARAALEEVWRRLVESERVRPAGITALNWSRTEAGIPWYGIDMDDRTLPMEVGLESAISMTKGCFLGQETLSRLHYRGRLHWKIGRIRSGAAGPPGVFAPEVPKRPNL